MATVNRIETLRARLAGVKLRHGAGEYSPKQDEPLNGHACAMQAVAWLANEAWSDAPACACRVVRRFVIKCNDDWDEANRQKLLEIVPLLVGSRATPEVESRRRYFFADWAIRILLPNLLDRLKRGAEAARLRAVGPVTDRASAEHARQEARSVRDGLRTAHSAYSVYSAHSAAAAVYSAAAAAAAAYSADSAAYSADSAAAAADAASYASSAADAARSDFADLCIAAIKGALAIGAASAAQKSVGKEAGGV